MKINFFRDKHYSRISTVLVNGVDLPNGVSDADDSFVNSKHVQTLIKLGLIELVPEVATPKPKAPSRSRAKKVTED